MLLSWTQLRPKLHLLLTPLISLAILAFYHLTNHSHAGEAHLLEAGVLDAADYVAYSVCHRLTTHSFIFAGRPMALCARCSGIYLGIAIAGMMLMLSGRARYALYPRRKIVAFLFIMVGVMAADGFNSLFFDLGFQTPYHPNNTLRLLTGFGTGIAMVAAVLPAFAQTVWDEPVWQPVLGEWRELIQLFTVCLITSLLILSNQPTVLYVLSIVSAITVVAILTSLYTILLVLVSRRDGFAAQPRQLVLPLLLGLLIALGQIVLISTLRFNLTGTMSGF